MGDKINFHLLDEHHGNVAPHTPKIQVLLSVHLALAAEYNTPHLPSYELPPGVTRRNIGEMMLDRLELINYLDPLRVNFGWLRQDMWVNVLARERLVNGGVVHEGDALNRNFTQFPVLQASLNPIRKCSFC